VSETIVWPDPKAKLKSYQAPFDLKELDAGCLIEQEHTPKRHVACKIAMDHLREDPKYYTKLCRLWPKERGCEYVRPPARPWLALLIIVGLGVTGYVLVKRRE